MYSKLRNLLLCAAIVCCASGCNYFAQEKDSQTIAEGLVASFFDDVIDGSLDDYNTYFEEDDDLRFMYNRVSEPTVDELYLTDTLFKTDILNADKLSEYKTQLAQKLFSNSDYEIESVRAEDDDEVKVWVKFITPTRKGVKDAVSELDVNAILGKVFTFDINDADAFSAELANREGLTEQELRTKYSAMTESEVAASVAEKFSDELDSFVSLASDEVINILPQDVIRMEFTVEKQFDGEWKISDVD